MAKPARQANRGDLRILDNFIGKLDLDKIAQKASIQLGGVLKDVDKRIFESVSKRYNLPKNTITASRIRGRIASSPERTGKFAYRNGLIYKYKAIDLARFVDGYYSGNLPKLIPNVGFTALSKTKQKSLVNKKKHKGFVHTVEVVKGVGGNIVFGHRGLGGFMPRYANGSLAYKHPKLGTVMFEREGRKRYPLVRLLAPSITSMIKTVWKTDTSLQRDVSKILEKGLTGLW